LGLNERKEKEGMGSGVLFLVVEEDGGFRLKRVLVPGGLENCLLGWNFRSPAWCRSVKR
jgi:hypothetical protein